jgi:hypothetical protein
MTRYKIIPVGATRWAVKRCWCFPDDCKWLQYTVNTDGTSDLCWINGFFGIPDFPSVDAALEALAWMIRRNGINLAHERQHERKLEARKDKAIHIPPWPSTNKA